MFRPSQEKDPTEMASIEKAQASRPGAQTVIGTGFVVDGEITGSENVLVHGTVKGRITLREGLVVDAGGTVEVAGQLTGNVSASERVELKAESRVTGDIRAPRILIADGALYQGSIDMDVKR
jgi:cytoskeletal protein CcmA (bactofilin family)